MSKPLIIAEKPTMARSIAKHLPGPLVSRGNYMETAEYVVTFAVGHLLKQADPEFYGADKFPGTEERLPIMPGASGLAVWKMEANDAKAQAQIGLIKKLLKDAPSIVHAGDPDREGQTIVDELLEFIGNKKPVKRAWLPSLDKSTVTKAFANLEDNAKYFSWYQAGIGRSRADWLIGMNISRILSIQGRKQGYRGTLSAGRIQTPVLAILDKREEEIRNFKAVDHYAIQAQCGGADVLPMFWAKWLPAGLDPQAAFVKEVAPENLGDDEEMPEVTEASTTAARPAYLDAANRLIDKTYAERVAAEMKASGKARVVRDERKEAAEPPPLLFELNSISSTMERLHGMDGATTMEACQSLYQKGHQSYPRTDSAYLREALKDEVPAVLAAIAQVDPGLASLMGPADPTRKSRIWNDDKCKVHYGLIPTVDTPNLSDLSQEERWVYLAVARQYLAQFYPDCIVDKALIELESAGHRLIARGRVVKSPGWRVLFSGQPTDESEKDAQAEGVLPRLVEGQVIGVVQTRVDALRTTPPPRFTEGSLKNIMKHAYRLVADPAERKRLKLAEGIGTAATRIPMVKMLIKRGLIVKKGSHLLPSAMASLLVRAVPTMMTSPGLTAQWESALDLVHQGKLPLATFEQKQQQFVQALLQQIKTKPLPVIPAAVMEEQAKEAAKRGFAPRPTGPAATPIGPKPDGEGKTCEKCKKGKMVAKTVQKEGPNRGKQFLSCDNYPKCKNMEWPK